MMLIHTKKHARYLRVKKHFRQNRWLYKANQISPFAKWYSEKHNSLSR